MKAKRISIMTYEGDRWQGHLVQRKLLEMLQQHGVTVASAVPGIAGCARSMGLTTRSLVAAGGRLPVVVEFVATQEELDLLLPVIRPMVGSRPITTAEIEIESAVNV